ncbi:unnamed protein product [Caenorhabditis bovis]|uniref:G-protein coupled receptors family 1 profile domain-containing protein n=1 Tax=Caenorhabditis bovis TaxID=2654633 RepID=A0A8S1EDK2_9PELO|nr:unnamed protein product [Caenorhabditis bovis]
MSRLGVNVRPPDANPYECRFYNAEFSILSSMISFVIPCVLVLFVYIRIIIALKKREKAAKLRREKNAAAQGLGSNAGADPDVVDEEAAGRIVAGPVVNVMMAALPSMTRRIRQFERHRRAIELAGDDEWDEEEYDDDDDDDDDVVVVANREYHADEGCSAVAASAPRTTSMIRRIISATSVSTSPTPTPTHHRHRAPCRDSRPTAPPPTTTTTLPPSHSTSSARLLKEHEFGNSSSVESLSENVHVITNDFISENCTTLSRRSSYADESQPSSSQASSNDVVKNSRMFQNLSRNYSTMHRRESRRRRSTSHADEAQIPSIIRSISRKSPKLFRKDKSPVVLENPNAREPLKATSSQTETETISASRDAQPHNMSRSTTVNSAELLGSPEGPMIDETRKDGQPTVSFALTVREMNSDGQNNVKACRKESAADNPPLAVKILTRPSLPTLELARTESNGTMSSSKTRADPLKSMDSRGSKKSRNGIAVKLVKKAIKHEHSLKRKVSKAQRKEKRATKTLGVVVVVFLVCWVPFFAINILNAVCILLNKEFCQVGYDLFFYSTWIGYMNSFMNPIIYTIFNTEFRRAFKSIIFGRSATRSHQKQANV